VLGGRMSSRLVRVEKCAASVGVEVD
jgi:hypothetical protein